VIVASIASYGAPAVIGDALLPSQYTRPAKNVAKL